MVLNQSRNVAPNNLSSRANSFTRLAKVQLSVYFFHHTHRHRKILMREKGVRVLRRVREKKRGFSMLYACNFVHVVPSMGFRFPLNAPSICKSRRGTCAEGAQCRSLFLFCERRQRDKSPMLTHTSLYFNTQICTLLAPYTGFFHGVANATLMALEIASHFRKYMLHSDREIMQNPKKFKLLHYFLLSYYQQTSEIDNSLFTKTMIFTSKLSLRSEITPRI